jgi:hypothetical protein
MVSSFFWLEQFLPVFNSLAYHVKAQAIISDARIPSFMLLQWE